MIQSSQQSARIVRSSVAFIASSPPSFEQPAEQRFLRVHAVLRLIEHRALRSVDDLVGDLFATMGRQVMQDDRTALPPAEQRRGQLKAPQGTTPSPALPLLTPARPP